MKNSQVIIGYENSLFIDFVVDKKYRWIRHCLLIGVIVGIHFLPSKKAEIDPTSSLWRLFETLLSITILLSLFYINHYILIPAFVLRSRFLAYAGSLLVVYTLIFLVLMYLERQELRFIQKPDRSYLDWEDYLIIVILLTIFIAAVSSMKLFKVWIVNLIRFKEFENNTLTIQLEQLKSQINPHFLFNTLNNINFLIDENPKLASKVLLKLSDVLRNQLYLSKGDSIELGKEIAVLKNILFMEDIRRDKFVVDFTIDQQMEQLHVPPFLFIPFVENVVKHSAHQAMEGGQHVQIAFSIQAERICFTCVNPKKRKIQAAAYGGLGLSNIQKRLEILYPNSYNLQIDDFDDRYKVFLSIPMGT